MKLQRFSVERPVTLTMCVLAVIVFGILAAGRLGLDFLPNLEYPTVAVVTVYPNADPETIENQVTRPIESVLATVNGLKKLESTSAENFSLVMASFDWGTDLSRAYEEIETLVTVASATLPAEAEKPLIARLDPSQLPVIQIGITGEYDPAELTRIVDQAVRPVIERVPGVARVSLLGGVYPQITVYYNTQALREALLTPLDLQTMLQAQNVTVPAGALVVDPSELDPETNGSPARYPIRVGNPIKSVEELRDLIISIPTQQEPIDSFGLSGWIPPQPIRLSDVATVVEETVAPEGFTRIDGQSAIILRVLKQSGENTVAVSQRVREAVRQLAQADLGLEFHIVTDQAQFVTESVASLRSAAIVGGLLAIAVLVLFLRSVRSLIVIAVSIPLSVLVALILLYWGGLSLNLMTLGGLAVAMGMLVDNAIIVLENIFRLRSSGTDPKQAAQQGASEMALAISASTLTTLAVFIPLAFVRSLAGAFFRDLAFAIGAALIGSLLVALTVVPMMAAHLPSWSFKRNGKNGRSDNDVYAKTRRPGFLRLQEGYRSLLQRVLARPGVAIGIGFVLIAGSLGVARQLSTGFLPNMDGSLITIELDLPAGTPLAAMDEAVREIEAVLATYPEIEFASVQVGNQGADDFISLVQESPIHHAYIAAILVPPSERDLSAHEIAADLRRTLPVPAEGRLRVSADRAVDALGDDYSMGLTIEILGPDRQTLEDLSGRITAALRNTPGFVDVTSTAEEVQPELYFEVDRLRAARALLTAGHVGLNVRYAFTGLQATTLQQGGVAVPVVILPEPDTVSDLASLVSFRVFNLQRDQEGIPNVSRLEVVTTDSSPRVVVVPRTIQHVDRQRMVRIKAQLDGIDLGTSRALAEAILTDLDVPPGYDIRLAGIHATLEESLQELWLTLALALLFVYMVMAAQFESLRHPFVIMFTVPFAAVGAFLALRATGQQLNVPALMGLITLAGISVNNGIVLVDTINRLRRAGMPLTEAIVTGSTRRLRPILMTTITTVFGLLPLALGWGEGTEIQVPLAVATMGGLISSMLLTLFMVPVIYMLLSASGRRDQTA